MMACKSCSLPLRLSGLRRPMLEGEGEARLSVRWDLVSVGGTRASLEVLSKANGGDLERTIGGARGGLEGVVSLSDSDMAAVYVLLFMRRAGDCLQRAGRVHRCESRRKSGVGDGGGGVAGAGAFKRALALFCNVRC